MNLGDKESNLIIVIEFRFETGIDSRSSTPTESFTVNLIGTQKETLREEEEEHRILPVVFPKDQDCRNCCDYRFSIENSIGVVYW